ncbi:biotin/lipoyl-binding protein [Alkalisalibacterium limincola]|uniref:Biotin/lipoyl-binding protein n=1 Tax=Alkalisalibacterium limincola TaxID=2699169 RepID=A0A5C8KXP6_9GAMM|nr:biotin/lipoyl-binding protein [Alkalisalibacterium limincola]
MSNHRRVACVLLVVLLVACGERGGNETGQDAPGPAEVEVQALKQVLQPRRVSAPASVEARNESELSSDISARVQRIHADVGATVAEGDLLLQLDDTDYRLALAQADARVASARSRVALARQRHERGLALVERQFISQDEVLRSIPSCRRRRPTWPSRRPTGVWPRAMSRSAGSPRRSMASCSSASPRSATWPRPDRHCCAWSTWPRPRSRPACRRRMPTAWRRRTIWCSKAKVASTRCTCCGSQAWSSAVPAPAWPASASTAPAHRPAAPAHFAGSYRPRSCRLRCWCAGVPSWGCSSSRTTAPASCLCRGRARVDRSVPSCRRARRW